MVSTISGIWEIEFMSVFPTWLQMVINHHKFVPNHQGFMNTDYYDNFLSTFCICFFMQKVIANDLGRFKKNWFSVHQAIGDFKDIWELCLRLHNILVHFYTSLLQVYRERTLVVVKENRVSGLSAEYRLKAKQNFRSKCLKSEEKLNDSCLKKDYCMNYRFKNTKLYNWPIKKTKLSCNYPQSLMA